MPVPPLTLLLLFATGLLAGVLNVIAGGGSFLTLPVLIFLGLPSAMANGTNRVALLMQNVGAVYGFSRHRVVDWALTLRLAPVTLIGAALGSWGALQIGDVAFRRILATLMLVITLYTLVDPFRGRDGDTAHTPPAGVLLAVFFGIGVYGGFIQAGVGFFLLAGTTLAGLDLVKGNAVKVLLVLLWTPVTLAVFGGAGMVDWVAGFVMGLGSIVGSLIGVRLTVLRGHAWVRTVVTVTIVLFAIQLWLKG